MSERAQHYRTVGKDDLTPRQREVLELVAAGKTNPEIAERLGITLDGAKFHIREILSKLGVESREEAAEWWKRERSIRSRVASALGGLAPSGWLKPAIIATAVGGGTLGVVAMGFALGGSDRGGSLDATPPAFDPGSLKWSTGQAMDSDPNIGLRFVMSATAPEACILDAVIGVSGYAATPDAFGGAFMWVMGGPAAVTVERQLVSKVETPVIVGRAANACNSGVKVLLTISTPAQSSYYLDPPLPPCIDPADGPFFEAHWTANVAAMSPGQAPWWAAQAIAPVTPTPTPPGGVVFCDVRTGNCPVPSPGPCSFPGCQAAAEVLRDIDGFLARGELFRVASDPPGMYSLKTGDRRVISLTDFRTQAGDYLRLSPTLVSVGDAHKNGVLDLLFVTADGRAFSIAIEPRAGNPLVPIGITFWESGIPEDGTWAESSFGTALYRLVQ